MKSFYQSGEGPLQGVVSNPVTEGNCVAERRGGERLEALSGP
jgi:hypothetical protein